jgi:hypothetical protein
MPFMETVALVRSPSFSLQEVRCRATSPAPSDEEEEPAFSVAVPTAGVYVQHLPRQDLVGTVGVALLQNRGDVHRTTHPAACGDRTIELSLSDPAAEPFTRPRTNGFPRRVVRVPPVLDLEIRLFARRAKDPAPHVTRARRLGRGAPRAPARAAAHRSPIGSTADHRRLSPRVPRVALRRGRRPSHGCGSGRQLASSPQPSLPSGRGLDAVPPPHGAPASSCHRTDRERRRGSIGRRQRCGILRSRPPDTNVPKGSRDDSHADPLGSWKRLRAGVPVES